MPVYAYCDRLGYAYCDDCRRALGIDCVGFPFTPDPCDRCDRCRKLLVNAVSHPDNG